MALEFWIPQHSFFSELDTKLSLTSPIQAIGVFLFEKIFIAPFYIVLKGFARLSLVGMFPIEKWGFFYLLIFFFFAFFFVLFEQFF